MKRLLLYLMLAVSGMISAQIVNIPDANFKQALLEASPETYIAIDDDGNYITIDINSDGEIQTSEAESIKGLIVNDKDISSIEGIQSFINIKLLRCSDNNLTSLPIGNLGNLEELRCDGNNLTTIDLTGLNNLLSLWFRNNQITNIDLSPVPNLYALICRNNSLEELDLSILSGLRYLDCGENSALATIDISNSPIMETISCDETSVSYLNLKNGGIPLISLQISVQEFLFVCVDENDLNLIENLFSNNENVLINNYCSSNPGGDYNTISGILSFDEDNNGCGGSDPLSPLVKVRINDGTDGGYNYTNFSGNYSFYTQEGTFTLTPEFENDWFTVTPASATVTLATVDNSTTTQDFCITANGVHPDLGALITSVVAAQPGFDATYRIVYFNKGNQTISGSVFFSFDDATMDYVSALPAEDFTSGNILGWNYTDLMPFESRSILVTLNTNSPQEDPAVNIGDMLPFSVTVMPTTGDETPDDNQFLYDQMVTGSFDPNDITCLEGKVAGPDMIGEYLHYNINFENTGDAAATFIVVKQVIDEAQFDVGSLQPLNTSHDVKVKVDGNVVEYRFDDIDLGPLEKGNIVFRIKSLSSLQVGDDIMQKAEIFFDYNWPILTNEAVTVFEVLGMGDLELDATVKIYPNPVKDNLNITAGHDIKSIDLYDLQGRLLQTALVKGTEATLNLSGRAAGVYFVKVMTEKGVKVEKIINE